MSTAPTVTAVCSDNRRPIVRAALTTATANTVRGHRIRGLLAELDDINADREMAARFVERGHWLRELRTEERDVWEHLHDALSTHPA